MTDFSAHTPNSAGEWHPLLKHLEAVAGLAGGFAEDFGAGPWGHAAGLWHDLGKFSPEFQQYLRSAAAAEVDRDRPTRGPDHSTAGAQHAVEAIPILGHLLAYSLAGHHGGLPDGLAVGSCLESRLKKEIPEWRHGLEYLPTIDTPEFPRFVQAAIQASRPPCGGRGLKQEGWGGGGLRRGPPPTPGPDSRKPTVPHSKRPIHPLTTFRRKFRGSLRPHPNTAVDLPHFPCHTPSPR